jgi:hypothetical protein
MSLSVDVNIEGFDGKMKGTVMVEKYGAEYSTVTVDGRRTADGRVILTHPRHIPVSFHLVCGVQVSSVSA